MELFQLSTDDQVADFLTKVVGRRQLHDTLTKLGIVNIMLQLEGECYKSY